MSQTNNTDTVEEMSLAIELWRESGLSQKAWCKQEGVPLGKFEYWKSKLEGSGKSGSRPKVKPAGSDSNFIPVEVDAPSGEYTSSSSGIIAITYPSGVKVTCPVHVPAGTLQTLLNPK